MEVEFATLSILGNMYICTSALMKEDNRRRPLYWILGFAIIIGTAIAHYFKYI